MAEKRLIEVKAVMSGVFYRRPGPDQPSYVEIGSQVKKKDVLGLLETMKVFQKVKSPASGTVKEIRAQNESAVKDGDVLLVLESD